MTNEVVFMGATRGSAQMLSLPRKGDIIRNLGHEVEVTRVVWVLPSQGSDVVIEIHTQLVAPQ